MTKSRPNYRTLTSGKMCVHVSVVCLFVCLFVYAHVALKKVLLI